MKTNQLTIILQKAFKKELDAWAAGDKPFSMGTQFDESILESAMEATDKPEAIAKICEYLSSMANTTRQITIMELARQIATFKEPELARAWTD